VEAAGLLMWFAYSMPVPMIEGETGHYIYHLFQIAGTHHIDPFLDATDVLHFQLIMEIVGWHMAMTII
jgi:hypothetical protein